MTTTAVRTVGIPLCVMSLGSNAAKGSLRTWPVGAMATTGVSSSCTEQQAIRLQDTRGGVLGAHQDTESMSRTVKVEARRQG